MVCQGYIDCSHNLIKLRMLATLLSPCMLFVMVVIEKNFVMTFVLAVVVVMVVMAMTVISQHSSLYND